MWIKPGSLRRCSRRLLIDFRKVAYRSQKHVHDTTEHSSSRTAVCVSVCVCVLCLCCEAATGQQWCWKLFLLNPSLIHNTTTCIVLLVLLLYCYCFSGLVLVTFSTKALLKWSSARKTWLCATCQLSHNQFPAILPLLSLFIQSQSATSPSSPNHTPNPFKPVHTFPAPRVVLTHSIIPWTAIIVWLWGGVSAREAPHSSSRCLNWCISSWGQSVKLFPCTINLISFPTSIILYHSVMSPDGNVDLQLNRPPPGTMMSLIGLYEYWHRDHTPVTLYDLCISFNRNKAAPSPTRTMILWNTRTKHSFFSGFLVVLLLLFKASFKLLFIFVCLFVCFPDGHLNCSKCLLIKYFIVKKKLYKNFI